MGKRNKILKSGLSKKNFQNVLQSKKLDKSVILNKTYNKINTNNIQQQNSSDMDEDDQMSVDNINKTTTRDLNKTVLNEDAVERQSKLFGIEKEKLRLFLENPLRHRRHINKVVLSKGQKRRQEKKEKFKKKKELVEKIKLNQTMMMNNTMNKSLNITKNLESGKNDNFNLNDFNHTLHNLMDEISENKKDETRCVGERKSKNSNNAKKLKNILKAEKEKIKKVIENKNYQANPLEAMKFHIKNAIIQQERNRKIEENYQKNYNFLNLNK